MYLSSVKGDHEQALPLARRSDKGDPATWIVIAKALRTTGDCVGALRAARRAFELAAPKSRHDPSRADERAHAKFEEVMALTWLGRLEEARSALGTLYDGYDSQARIRWRGWARYVNGGLQVLDGRGRDALSELAAAYEFFEADDSSGQRKVACKLVEAAAKRILGDTSAAARIRISRGIDPVLLDLRAALDFELAEAAREQGPARYDEAERRYRAAASVAKRPLLNCAALIGLAELEHGRGDDGRPTLERARELALEHGFRRLQVDAVVTAYRIRLVSRDKAALQLSDLLDALPRFGLDTPSVDRVLDEPNHRLVCVW
jgi:tetratricopeptide (TPR) repeat protein